MTNIAYFIGSWFYIAAIFCGIFGGRRGFEGFIGFGTLILIVSFLTSGAF